MNEADLVAVDAARHLDDVDDRTTVRLEQYFGVAKVTTNGTFASSESATE